jgi:uncharacterized protein (DUF1501 family)
MVMTDNSDPLFAPLRLCVRPSRRAFLADIGMGFTGLALGAMLARDGVVCAGEQTMQPKPKAKSVIWIFLVGGMSHVESFDPKPELNKHAGKTIEESPFKALLDSPYLKKNVREFVPGQHKVQPTIYPMQVGYAKHGQCGLEISDWFPHLASHADDLAIVRSMWTTDNDHGAQLQFHTGRHAIEGPHPTIGSWIHWGLGSLNDNLPSFCVLGTPLADCCGGVQGHGANYLGPEHAGIQLSTDPAAPLPFAQPEKTVFREEQAAEFALLGKLNRLAGVEYPDDPALAARIHSYELAFQMQRAVPEAVDLNTESAFTHQSFGLEQKETKTFGQQLVIARRLVERGVRFVQIFHGSTGGAGAWDAHSNLQAGHSKLAKEIDQPIGALLSDLKERGLLDETIVVLATEFGRTPGAERSNGRDHHPYGFSVALAGGGIQGGVVHGATDELGFHAAENRHYVTDIHATVFSLLGLDHRHLEIPGRKRLELDFGQPIRDIMV